METWRIIALIMGWILGAGVICWLYRNRNGLNRFYYCTLITIILAVAGYFTYCAFMNQWYRYHMIMPVKEQYAVNQPIKPDEYIDDFNEICSIIERHYKLADAKGISLSILKKENEKEIKKAQDNREYCLALQKYFAGLKNMHTCPIYDTYIAFASAEWRKDSLYVIVNETGLPFSTGDKILSVDGMDAHKWKEKMMEYSTASTDKARAYMTAKYVFASYTDTIRILRISHNDSVFTVTVPLNESAKKEVERYEKKAKEQEDSKIKRKKSGKPHCVETISLGDFSQSSAKRFIEHYKRVRHSNNLILDIMNNTGGLKINAERIASLLIKKPYKLNNGKEITPDSLAFKGKLYVMIGPSTSSAAEYLTNILKETGSAILVGDDTGGDFGTAPLKFRTSHNTYFTVGTGIPRRTPAGNPTEGKGVSPDIKIIEKADLPNFKNTYLRILGMVLSDKIKQLENQSSTNNKTENYETE